ncbi:MAG: HNH endonuclease [Microgenomates group bacterium]
MPSWQHKGTRHERGYGSQWVKARKLIIARDGGLCQPCLRKGRPTPFDEVDHIVPKAHGGTDHHDNLQCICETCHRDKTLADEGKRAKTMIGVDGWPIAWGFP